MDKKLFADAYPDKNCNITALKFNLSLAQASYFPLQGYTKRGMKIVHLVFDSIISAILFISQCAMKSCR